TSRRRPWSRSGRTHTRPKRRRSPMRSSTTVSIDEDVEPILMPQFDDLDQQQVASNLGMWMFLATEVMFFGGLIAAYVVYRALSPHEFGLASRHLNLWLGCVNTVVLLGSSLAMAMAVRSAQLRQRREVVRFLVLTMALGLCFLGIKA